MKAIPKVYYRGTMTKGRKMSVYTWDRESFQVDISFNDGSCMCIYSSNDLNIAIDYAQNRL